MFGNTCVSTLIVYNSQIAKLNLLLIEEMSADHFWKLEYIIIQHYSYLSLILKGRERK